MRAPCVTLEGVPAFVLAPERFSSGFGRNGKRLGIREKVVTHGQLLCIDERTKPFLLSPPFLNLTVVGVKDPKKNVFSPRSQ